MLDQVVEHCRAGLISLVEYEDHPGRFEEVESVQSGREGLCECIEAVGHENQVETLLSPRVAAA